MPQAFLPLIPKGVTGINEIISVNFEEEKWTYFCGIYPIFFHEEKDRRSFRMFTSQLVCQGQCKQAEIIRVFGVSKKSVGRNVKKFKERGAEAFFKEKKGHGGFVLDEENIGKAQELFNQGHSRKEVSWKLNIKADTIRKAINKGKLSELKNKGVLVSDKSERSVLDSEMAMGVACTRPVERILASVGKLIGAETRFENCRDVSYGSLLCALPALVANGLFSHLEECFSSLKGYYTNVHILILLAYMALSKDKDNRAVAISSARRTWEDNGSGQGSGSTVFA